MPVKIHDGKSVTPKSLNTIELCQRGLLKFGRDSLWSGADPLGPADIPIPSAFWDTFSGVQLAAR